MGGSYDPVHIGHLIIAQDAVERLELDEIIFIPAAIPPHKQHLRKADAEHRLNMLRIAVENDLRFSVSDLELQRGGVSYTFDTIRNFKAETPDVEFFLIVGSDTLVDLHNWHNIDGVLDLCEVASFIRPEECDLDQIKQKVRVAARHRERLLNNLFESHLIGVSSTEIRMRVAEGLGIGYLVPPEVKMYIYEHGLYQT